MRCPECGELAPEGTAICQNCNEILDPSFLEGDDGPAAGERTDVGPPPTMPAPGRGPARPARPPNAPRPNPARGNWNPKQDREPGGPAAGFAVARGTYLDDAPKQRAPDALEEARRSAQDLGAFFRGLPAVDRWASGAAAALLAAMALPWRWTKADDEVIGLVAAWPSALLAAAVLAIVYLKARRADARQERTLQLAQVAAALLACLHSGWCLRAFADTRLVRAAGKGVAMVQSAPQPALYLGLAFAAVAFLASAFGAIERRR